MVNSSIAVGDGWYIQLIGRDISKQETFVLDGDMQKMSWIKLSDCWATPDYSNPKKNPKYAIKQHPVR